jgi:hypothetical protein
MEARMMFVKTNHSKLLLVAATFSVSLALGHTAKADWHDFGGTGQDGGGGITMLTTSITITGTAAITRRHRRRCTTRVRRRRITLRAGVNVP